MAFEVVAASYQERARAQTPLRRAATSGLVYGGVILFLALVGILAMFNGRWIVVGALSLGHTVLALAAIAAGARTVRGTGARTVPTVLAQGALSGAVGGLIVVALIAVIHFFDLRSIFIALTPALEKALTLGRAPLPGALLVLAGSAVGGAAGGLLRIAPDLLRRPLIVGLSVAGALGLFQELIQLMLQPVHALTPFRRLLYTWEGLRPGGAVGVTVVVGILYAVWLVNRPRALARFASLPESRQKTLRWTTRGVLAAALLIGFPLLAGNYIGQVLMLIGLYTLMGMGLNIEIGLAGLLDLGFVAFFAAGAYTVALLTADSPVAIAHWSFWAALPVAVLVSLTIGVLFGVPVLKVRGDYLAVATMGLGEIVRVIVESDMAKPLLGGAQGVLNIPRPAFGSYHLNDPVQLFFLTFALAALVAFVAWRLENSRLGRAWMAIRDDEEVAQALGINLVNVKLLAYGLGASFAGVAGAIFAVMLTTIYPTSFQLIVSINVLALIIVGGVGSLPGVAVGAAVLIGLPELLREFGEYRFLFYGAAIVGVMRMRPSGLWPSAARKRELQIMADTEAAVEAELHGAVSAASEAVPGDD